MLEALVVAETVAIGLLGVIVAGLLRSHGEVLRTLHKLGAGLEPDARAVDVAITATPRTSAAVAAPVEGVTLDDEAVSVPVAQGRDVLLAFLSSGCETCLPFWQALASSAEVPGGAEVLIVTGGPERESESLLRRLAPKHVPLVMSTAAWEAYDVPGSPHFVYVDGATGTIAGEGTAPSWPQVVSLLERAAGDRRLAQSRSAAAPLVRDQDEPTSVDAALAAAGITAGDTRLYADPSSAAS